MFFKQNILKFIHLGPNKVFKIYNPHGLKLLKRLRLGLVIYEVTNLDIISVTVLMKFVCVDVYMCICMNRKKRKL